MNADEFVLGFYTTDGKVSVFHRNGIRWDQAPLPSRFHRCRVQTFLSLEGRGFQRCACGAIRLSGRLRWMHRNLRRCRIDWDAVRVKLDSLGMSAMEQAVSNGISPEVAGRRIAALNDHLVEKLRERYEPDIR